MGLREKLSPPAVPEALWRQVLVDGHPAPRLTRAAFKLLPSEPRCKFCNAPFEGWGSGFMRALGRARWVKNPSLCGQCFDVAYRAGTGGVELEMSVLFADIRGSTTLAEKLSPKQFADKVDRFYRTGSAVLTRSDAWIDRLVGDELVGYYVPGLAGAHHARAAVNAALELLERTGHGSSEGPWIPVGAGVHTGIAFMGAVGEHGHVTDVTALGDSMNVGARLASQAAAGEVIVSDTAWSAAGLDLPSQQRRLQLKGRQEGITVRVLRPEADAAALTADP